jgi:hypothetical protein
MKHKKRQGVVFSFSQNAKNMALPGSAAAKIFWLTPRGSRGGVTALVSQSYNSFTAE